MVNVYLTVLVHVRTDTQTQNALFVSQIYLNDVRFGINF